MNAILGVLILIGTIAVIWMLKPGADGREKAFLRRTGMGAAVSVLITAAFAAGAMLIANGVFGIGGGAIGSTEVMGGNLWEALRALGRMA